MQNEDHSSRQVNHTGIPTQLMERLGQSTGISLADVRVHYNSSLPAKPDALAYTKGNQVEIGPGQERHLPHGLGHVVQQKLGAVRANAMHSSGVALNTDAELEHQADEIGAGKRISGSCLEQGQVTQLYKSNVTSCDISYSNSDSNKQPPDGLCTSTKPTMVFESMGTNMKDCTEIIKQSEQYDGNTICVFELNACGDANVLSALNSEITDWSKKNKMEKGGTSGKPLHLLYVFPFYWSKLDPQKNHGYEMPFVEARLAVMEKAEVIVKGCIQQNPLGGPQNNFLYRWIDADAREDTSNDVAPEILNGIATSDDNKILTGRYDRRHADDKEATSASAKNTQRENAGRQYDLFITKINQAEKELRDYYHYLCTLRGKTNARKPRMHLTKKRVETHVNGKGGLYPFDKSSFLPGYYLPETTLIMNQAAHASISGALRRMMENEGNNKTLFSQQDEESMQAVGKIVSGNDIDVIVYDSRLCVQKPLKNEYQLGNASQAARGGQNAATAQNPSYWGDEMLKFLRGESKNASNSQDQGEQHLEVQEVGNSPISSEKMQFISGLNNLRQSAFSNWYFTNKSPWNRWEEWDNLKKDPQQMNQIKNCRNI